ncbi:DUF2273 domain-containing protein [Leuconostoc falkenbergense]|uniref:DUF2273 domain-containing protein n=1 Tax=Leuconostoc falkenbergense TaxID=2766470 RepID=UPI00166E2FDE|nr:DUF2273 domain-containing protein [Leuconostoc falkenbergense]
MKSIKVNKAFIGGIIGFVLATLLVTLGFWKTILVLTVTIIIAYIGSVLDEHDVNIKTLLTMMSRKNR